MSTAGRNGEPAATASDLAATLADADFVRLYARADGDSLAAAGVLAKTLSAIGTPFQASVADPSDPVTGATQADCTLAVGDLDVAADATVNDDVAASATAFDVAGELAGNATEADGDGSDRDAGVGPDPILALAGTIAAGEVVPPVVDAAEAVGVERRPGVSLPVDDLADGLAHSTLVHGSFSGDVDASDAALADLELADPGSAALEETDRRRVASLVALDASAAEDAPARAADAVERALHPYVGGPFETVGGYADVLDAAAHERPGVALALALGHDGVRDEALDAWRQHGRAAHAALSEGETERHDGLFVVRAGEMPVATVARLAAEFRSPEPVSLAVADGEAAIHAVDDDGAAVTLETAVDGLDGTATGTGARARARFDTDVAEDWTAIADEFAVAVREAL